MKNFDDFVSELMDVLTRIARNYDLLQVPDDETPGYAERVRLRARLASMGTLLHWMALDLSALDSVAEETRRINARYESIRAAKQFVDSLADNKPHIPQAIPAAPEPEEEESARVRMAAIGVSPPEEMTYAEYAQMLSGEQNPFPQVRQADVDAMGDAAV
ncbi:MAG: hypothetical protein LBR87_08965 [Synergistaceae bacterium]|jgi:hypothetical protein|nr:hypothetical protein [Synergistaceae bacterium]